MPALRRSLACPKSVFAESSCACALARLGLVGQHLQVRFTDRENEVAAAGQHVEIDNVRFAPCAFVEFVRRQIEELLVRVENRLRYVDFDDGGKRAGISQTARAGRPATAA